MKFFILLLSISFTEFTFCTEDEVLSQNKSILSSRYSDGFTIHDISKYAKNYNKLEYYKKLEVFYKSKTRVHIETEKAPIIRSIDLITNLKKSKTLHKIKNKYIGKPDSEYTLQLLQHELLEHLSYLGYPNSYANIQREDKNNKVHYDFTFFLEQPCKIKQILIPGDLKDLTLPLDIEIGDICDFEMIQRKLEDAEKELQNDYYQTASLSIEDAKYSNDSNEMTLSLKVALGPRVHFEFIEKSLFFVGNALDTDTANYFRRTYANPSILKKRLIEYYKDKAYNSVHIEGPFRQIEKDGLIVYLFFINPGPQYHITKVNISGAHKISEFKLRKEIFSENILENLSSQESKSIDSIVNSTTQYYHSQGYWNVKIKSANLDYISDSSTAILNMSLEEGTLHTLADVNIRGNEKLSDEDILHLLNIQKGDPLEQEKVAQLEFKIREQYFLKGFLQSYIGISLVHTLEEDLIKTTVNINITEGPLTYIGTISIQGLIDTKALVLERELHFKQGDVYSQKHIDESREAILSLGLFSSVSIERTSTHSRGNSEEMDLVIKVRENDAGHFKFGPGYNFLRGLQYSSEIAYHNLQGIGRKISLRGAVSQEMHQRSISPVEEKESKTLLGNKLGLSFTEPYLFNFPISGNISLYHEAIADDIWKKTDSAEFSLTHVFKRTFFEGSITPFYRLDLLQDLGTPDQSDSLVTTGFSRVVSVGLRYRLDKRDNLRFPRSGYLFQTELSQAHYSLFSQYRYFKWTTNLSSYWELFSNFVWANHLTLGSYMNVHKKDEQSVETIDVLPANQRFLAGGPNDVRGFDEQLGPSVLLREDNGFKFEPPLGGSQLFIFKTEFRKEIIPELFSMSLFWDSGNSFFTSREVDTFNNAFQKTNSNSLTRSVEDNFNYKFEELLTHPEYLLSKNFHSLGLSFGLLTPLGAINASLGWPIHEPKSTTCNNEEICFLRQKAAKTWIQKVHLTFNIGAEF